jgi:hypothetical protein
MSNSGFGSGLVDVGTVGLDVGVVVSEIVWSCMARLYSSLTKANNGKDVIVDTMIA